MVGQSIQKVLVCMSCLLQASNKLAGAELEDNNNLQVASTRQEQSMQELPSPQEILALPQHSSQSKKHLRKGEYLEVALTSINDLQYTTKVYLGSQDEERTLLFDTGSNAVWLTSDLCETSPENCDNKHAVPYRIEDSAFGRYYEEVRIDSDGSQITYHMPERDQAGKAEIHYGQGLVRGVKAKDRLCIRGQASGDADLCVAEQQLISVDTTKDLENLHADGILGLSPRGSDQFLSSLKASKRIQDKVFSFSLESSIFTLGGFDNARFSHDSKSSLEWFPLQVDQDSNEPHWSIALPSLKVNDRAQPLQNQVAILDTGTSLISVPATDFELLKSLLEDESQTFCSQSEAGNLECSCGLSKSYSDFPDIHFNFNQQAQQTSLNSDESVASKQSYFLAPEDYMTKIGLTCYMKFNRQQPLPMGSTKKPYWVLGATFLRKYYTVFDLDQKQVGLSRSSYQPIHSLWPQAKYYTLRALMLACVAYMLYEILFVRVLQQHFRLCLRKSVKQNRRQNLVKKELVVDELEVGYPSNSEYADNEELELSFTSDQQSSQSYDDSCSNMDESEQSGRHSDTESISSLSQRGGSAEEQSFTNQSESHSINQNQNSLYQRKRKMIANNL